MYSVATSNGLPVDLFSTLIEPSQYAKDQFQIALNASGYQGILYFYASHHVPNALAASRMINNTGYPYNFVRYDRYIIYNPNYMHQMEFWSDNQFVTHTIFAHEIGHHFNSHTDGPSTLSKHSIDKEIEADFYSGFVLAIALK